MDDIEALQAFDIDDDLKRLEDLLQAYNVFAATGMHRQELRHSNVLASLLDPTLRHGLGDLVVRGLLRRVMGAWPAELGRAPYGDTAAETVVLGDTLVRREWNDIDILLECRALRLVVVIENKIDSSLHSQQLARNREVVQSQYQGWKYAFVLLSKVAVSRSDLQYESHFVALLYTDVISVLEAVRDRYNHDLKSPGLLAIDHYLALVRRHIMGDKEMVELCRDIYERHRKAIDAINRHGLTVQKRLVVHLEGLIGTDFRFHPEKSDDDRVRFTVNTWRGEALDCEPTASWKASQRVTFEFTVQQSDVTLWLVVDATAAPVLEGVRDALSDDGMYTLDNLRRYPTAKVLESRRSSNDDIRTFVGDREAIDDLWMRFCNHDFPRIQHVLTPRFAVLNRRATGSTSMPSSPASDAAVL